MNGLSWKNSTAFTSRSILAVVSATSALSAKCMCGADFSRLKWSEFALGRVAMRLQLAVWAVAALIGAPQALLAQPKAGEYTYRCVGNDGKKYYGSTIPNACLGRPLELINQQGLMVKRIDPEGDEKARRSEERRVGKECRSRWSR